MLSVASGVKEESKMKKAKRFGRVRVLLAAAAGVLAFPLPAAAADGAAANTLENFLGFLLVMLVGIAAGAVTLFYRPRHRRPSLPVDFGSSHRDEAFDPFH